jgi:hypothetical protein
MFLQSAKCGGLHYNPRHLEGGDGEGSCLRLAQENREVPSQSIKAGYSGIYLSSQVSGKSKYKNHPSGRPGHKCPFCKKH